MKPFTAHTQREYKMKAGTRVKIVSIHKEDAFYHNSTQLVGATGTVAGQQRCGVAFKHPDKRHYAVHITLDVPYCGCTILGFYKIKLERI